MIGRFYFWNGLTVVLMSDLPFSSSSCFCSFTPLYFGFFSCLSTLIILLMYAWAKLDVLTCRFSSGVPPSTLEFFRPFPVVKLSHTVPPEPPLLRPSSVAEFFLFLPANKPPIPPSLRWFPFRLSRENEGLMVRGCGPDSEAERTLSLPFFKLIGKSLNHFAILAAKKNLFSPIEVKLLRAQQLDLYAQITRDLFLPCSEINLPFDQIHHVTILLRAPKLDFNVECVFVASYFFFAACRLAPAPATIPAV